jgi:hypothetical protein
MPHLEDRETRVARQREEGKIAMRDYLQRQQNTLQRMAELRAQRLAKQNVLSPEEQRERMIDEALEESFPASDPPSFVGH